MYSRRFLTLSACIGSFFTMLPIQALSEGNPACGTATSVLSEQLSTQLSTEQLYRLAQSITVKVLSGDTWGSGIIIQQQGQIYTVLTNQHVLNAGESYRIQTPDGRIYPGNLSTAVNFNGNDLGLLQFRSADLFYRVASLRTSSNLEVGDQVFAGGFPTETDPSSSMGFVFTTGQISLLLDKALQRGYRLGYTNNIQKGMSGGPLLNCQGQVVGINGKHAYPLWGDTFVFQDGSRPNQTMREQMIRSSFAIPVETFIQLSGKFSHSLEMPAANPNATTMQKNRPVQPQSQPLLPPDIVNPTKTTPLPEQLW